MTNFFCIKFSGVLRSKKPRQPSQPGSYDKALRQVEMLYAIFTK